MKCSLCGYEFKNVSHVLREYSANYIKLALVVLFNSSTIVLRRSFDSG